MAVALPGLLAIVLRCLAVVLGLPVALRGRLPVTLGSGALAVALRGLLPVALGCGALSVAGLSVALGGAGGVGG